MHFSMRKDIPNIWFFEKIEFLVQTMILQMDDELIGFFFKFTSNIAEQMQTNITGVHEVFLQQKLREYDEYELVSIEGDNVRLGRSYLPQINEGDEEDDIFSALERKDR